MANRNALFEGLDILEVRGQLPEAFRQLACDSRLVGEGALFAALRGTAFDGHRFAADAARRGAIAAVVEEFTDAPVPQVRVAGTLKALPRLAANFYGHPARSLTLHGVTGSNGKTTSTYLQESVFKAAGRPCAVIGTIEYRLGGRVLDAPNTTPLAHDLHELLRDIVNAGLDDTVMEVSSHALALHRVDGIEFDTALFTNLSQDHLDFHPSMEHYRDTKKRLFTEFLKPSGVAALNIDDEAGRLFAAELRGKNAITYGFDPSADVRAADAEIELTGTRFALERGGERVPVQTRLVGRHNIYNMLGVAAVSLGMGLPMDAVRRGLEAASPAPGRLEPVENSVGAQILVDYCHTPDALEKCLELLKAVPHKRLIALFGCGGDRDRKKRPLMGGIALRLADYVIVTSDNPRTEDPQAILDGILEGMKSGAGRYEVIPDRREAIRAGVDMLGEGDLFLIAGKGHETYQIIGREKRPFDDRAAARDCLAAAGKA